jgi:hypothetical protein
MGAGWQQFIYPRLWAAHNAFSLKNIKGPPFGLANASVCTEIRHELKPGV